VIAPLDHGFVSLTQVSKHFSGIKALDQVSFDVANGEIVALVGENGAGKSTLMKVLSGVYADGDFQGEIKIRGEPVRFRSPADAEAAGIAIIHQELSVFPHLSVGENMAVGHWPKKNGLVDWPAIHTTAKSWLKKVGADFDPDLAMSELSVGQMQQVEIAKALALDFQLLILDEPTSSLSPGETERLFTILRNLRGEGRAIVYISHKLEEVYALADRVLVLRDGQSVFSSKVSEVTQSELITKMVGRPLDRVFPNRPEREMKFVNSVPVFRVQKLEIKSLSNGRTIGPIDFEAGRGEIVGFAGLLGAGRTEVMQALLGGLNRTHDVRGEVFINDGALDHRLNAKVPREAWRRGLALVSEDRKAESILPQRSLEENTSLSRLSLQFLLRLIRPKLEDEKATASLSKFRTKYQSLEQEIRELSGGNQQKIVIARALQAGPNVLILDEPTRGVDVGAKFEIYQILFDLAKAGKTLLVVSSDLPELLALSDRIYVMSGGRIAGQVKREYATQENVMSLAVGGIES
jgi:D-xylose transport system ATP-binding protein